jgi:hypothetical protein
VLVSVFSSQQHFSAAIEPLLMKPARQAPVKPSSNRQIEQHILLLQEHSSMSIHQSLAVGA